MFTNLLMMTMCFVTMMSVKAKTCTHTHPFKGPLSWTTRVSRYQKGKTNLDFTDARDSEWQWHQLGHMQVTIKFVNTILHVFAVVLPSVL